MELVAMKWVFFVLSLLMLFFANNTLFWVPGQPDWFTFVAAGIAISLAVLFAWLSSRRFVAASSAVGRSKGPSNGNLHLRFAAVLIGRRVEDCCLRWSLKSSGFVNC
jgi:hypothetical protein